jgi:hypothetical protein
MTTIRRITLIRSFAAAVLLAGLGVYSAVRLLAQSGSISITAGTTNCPNGGAACVLKAGPDFASDTFADPWDFNNREDVAIDPMQNTGISNFAVAPNVVSGTALDSSGHFAILERPWVDIINPGKTGRKFQINQGQYSKLAVKFNGASHPRVYWFNTDIGVAGAYGWHYLGNPFGPAPAPDSIYVMDLTQANPIGGPGWTPWTNGLVESLAIYPNDSGSPVNFSFDWVRLTAGDNNPSAAMMTINWSGVGSSGNITVTDAAGTSYLVKTGISGSSFTWNYGVLPPGNYTLQVGNTTKAFRVNAPPVIHVTEPDETGGADFATDVMQNPWDMNDVNDVFHNVNIIPHVFNESFVNGVYNATSDGVTVGFAGSIPVGDAQVYLLSNQKTSNTHDIIDSTKYHRLTFDMLVDHAFNLGTGSVARVFWGSTSSATGGGTPYNLTTSKDIITWPGKNIYTIDLATLTTANGGLEPSNATPWTQNAIRHFRIDPFEFAEQVTFHMDNVKLAADDAPTGGNFTIKWIGSDADPGDSPLVDLYYQPAGGSLTLIQSSILLAAGQYVWNTSSLSPGTYSVFAIAHDALNSTGQYATGPVTVSPPVAATPNPFMDFDTPREGYVVTSAFEVGGWAIDAGSPTGTGVDAVQVYVFPNNGASPGVFIGNASYGLPRPDVAAFFGNANFTNCGFHFSISGLGPGAYVLGAYGRSTVTGGFTVAKTIHFTVNANQLMAVNPPVAEAIITAPVFDVDGWSIDKSVETTAIPGPGVDTLHVYAYPNPGSGAPAIFLGVATYGLSRPDVASVYGGGGPRYVPSGFHLAVDRSALGLANGVYGIVVFSHSTVTGTFNNLAIVRVTLQ